MSLKFTTDLKELGFDVAEHTKAMLAYWDNNLICRFANHAYQDWFGVNPEQLINKMHIKDLLGSIYFKNLPYIQGVLNGKVQVFERDIVTPAGAVRHSLATYCPHFEDGKVKGFYVHVVDISLLKLTEQERLNEKSMHNIETDVMADVENFLKRQLFTGFPGIPVIAKTHFISVSKLKRDFNERYHSSIFKYFRNLQMKIAHTYISENKCSRKQMATMMNFPSPSSFLIPYNKFLSANRALYIAEKIKRASIDLYETFVRQSPVCIAMFNKNLELMAASELWNTTYYATAQSAGGSSLKSIKQFQKPEWHTIFSRALKGEIQNSQEEKVITGDNKESWMRWDVRPWFDNTQTIEGVMILTEDITALKNKEEENKKILKILNKTNEIARIGAWKRNFRTNRRIWDKITKDIFEVSHDFDPSYRELLGFIKEGESRQLVEKVINDVIQHGKGFDIEVEIITARQTIKTVRIIGFAEFIDARCETISGIIQDISLEKIRSLYKNFPFDNGDINYTSYDSLATTDP